MIEDTEWWELVPNWVVLYKPEWNKYYVNFAIDPVLDGYVVASDVQADYYTALQMANKLNSEAGE